MAYSCKTLEPMPDDVIPVGASVISPGGSFHYTIVSVPFCRIYWNEVTGKSEPNIYESAWCKNVDGKWTKERPNYVSYRAVMTDYPQGKPFDITPNSYYKYERI